MAREKIIYNSDDNSTTKIRKAFTFYYLEYFYNKWMNRFSFPELDYQQNDFIMRKFWADGTVACINILHSAESLKALEEAGLEEVNANYLAFTPWTTGSLFNIYDYPISARPVNKRGVPFIPNKDLALDKDIVIGYAQKNKKSVLSSIQCKINELVDIEMKMRVSRKAQSQPWTFAVSPEDEKKLKQMQVAIENDEPYNFVDLIMVDKVKVLQSGAPYITDKQEQDRQKVMNDILTILGYNNVGVSEKKEHLTVNEVDSNNQEIESSGDSYKTMLEDFFARIQKAFGFKVTVVDNYEKISDNYSEDEYEEEDGEDDE